MDTLTRNRLKKLLVGSLCVDMDNRGDYLQILLGSRWLIVESAWRVVHDRDIIVGSVSEDAVLEKLPDILVGQTVRSVVTHGEFNDLRLEFNNGAVLEAFADSERFEHWKLAGGPEEMIIAGPGRLWSEF